VYTVQAAMAQEEAGWHPALKISAWMPSKTVHQHFKHWNQVCISCSRLCRNM